MRLVPIPPPANERHVVWADIESVRYVAVGHDRCFVLKYRGGGERYLQIHQALALWHDIKPQSGCEPPCYFEGDVDTADETCAECQLCEKLSGIKRIGELRPRPIRQPRPERNGWQVFALVLVALVAVLLGMLAQADGGRTAEGDVRTEKGVRQ